MSMYIYIYYTRTYTNPVIAPHRLACLKDEGMAWSCSCSCARRRCAAAILRGQG